MEEIRIGIIELLVLVFLLAGCPDWLHNDAWPMAFMHHFFHANIFHLAVNCYSLWILLRAKRSIWVLIVAYLCATLSWFASDADPIGASNFIFALVGLCSPHFRHPWWRSRPTIIFLALNLAMLLLPQVSAITHIVSFSLGCMLASIRRGFKSLSRDIGNR